MCLAGAGPAYYPSGVQLNVPVSTVTNAGWTVCYDQPYSHATTEADLDGCSEKVWIMMAAKASSTAASLELLAAGETAAAMSVTAPSEPAQLHNGAYWYRRTSSAVGFASEAPVSMFYGLLYDGLDDNYDVDCEQRLSWTTTGGAGGWQAGCSTGLVDDTTRRKLIFVYGKRSSSSPPCIANFFFSPLFARGAVVG